MESKLTIADAKAFIFGGNATVTLVSTKTGTRFTYRIRQRGEDTEKSPFFVSVMSGPDNESNYQYIGFIPVGSSNLVAGKKGKPDSPSFKALSWALPHIMAGNIPEALEVWHEGRCGACNRKLTVPESIASGFGPECIKRRNK